MEEAKKILQDKYDQAKDNPNITDPVEWALYRTWQIVKRRNRNDRIRKNNK